MPENKTPANPHGSLLFSALPRVWRSRLGQGDSRERRHKPQRFAHLPGRRNRSTLTQPRMH